MRKSVLLIAISFLLVCLFVVPSSATVYVGVPSNVVEGVEAQFYFQNVVQSSYPVISGTVNWGDGSSVETLPYLYYGSPCYAYHTYTSAGSYTITCNSYQQGYQSTDYGYVTVDEAYFTIDRVVAEPASISRGDSVTVYADHSTNYPNSGLTYIFYLKKGSSIVDSQTVNSSHASFTINDPGTYTPGVLVYYDGISIAGDVGDAISVAGTATISANKTVILPQSTVAFTASTSAGTVSSWDWNFDDGSTTSTSTSSVSHTYSTAGTYSVSVTANLAGGGTDAGSQSNYISVVNPPVVSSVSISPSSQTVNNAVTASIAYSSGSTAPSGYTAYIRVNDGLSSQDYSLSSYSSPISRSITYTSQGTKTVNATGILKSSSDTLLSPTTRSATVSILPEAPGGLSFTTVPSNGEIEKGDSVTFTASVTSGGSVTSYVWNYGDGATETVTTSQTSHTYTTVGTYAVSVTAVGPGGNTTYTKQNAVIVGETYVTLNKSTYYIGVDTSISATYSISPYDSSAVYTLELWQLNDLYEPSSKVSSITLNSATGTKSFNIASITSNSNYNVYIVTNGGYIASAPATVRYNGDTLTVYVYNGNQPLTANTRVALQQNGVDVMVVNTSSGTAFFAPLTSGQTYTIVASSSGYETQSTSVTLSGDMSVTLSLGSSLDTGGWGQWEPFACSWQIFDKNGATISGATVTLQQVTESFGDISIFNQWNGFSIGETLVGAPQTLISDVYGKVTFNCFPNVFYRINVTYDGETETQYFNTGAVTTTYPFTFGKSEKENGVYNVVYASVSTNQADGKLTVIYTDTLSPAITTNILIQLYNSNNTLIDQWTAPTSSANQTFTISDRYNNDYTVKVTASTSQGQYTKKFSVHFLGPRLNFGIPDTLLIWISAFLLFAVGGAFSRISVSIGCVAVSLLAWLLYGIGWLWQLEAAVTQIGLGVILFFATFVSILFIIAENR